jgi:hypothetical protein
MMRTLSPPVLARLLCLAVPAAFGALALALGMDANWDLRNYHYYNAWAFLTDRYGQDIAVAQIPSFYNPLLDVPYFLLAQVLPARVLAVLLGSLHGLNFCLLAALGDALLPGPAHSWRRAGLCLLAAGAGVCGAVALSEVGTVFYDNLLSLGLFAALLAVVRFWPTLVAAPLPRALPRAILAGLPVGLAFGLKQTSVIYAVGVWTALLVTLPVPPARRLAVALACGLGICLGLAAGGGYWMAHLWSAYANPLFPMFNQLFRSPWGLADSYRDTQYLDGPFWRRLFYPVLFAIDSRQAGEIVFRDFRLLAAFLLIPLAGLAVACRRTGKTMPVSPRPAAFVMLAASLSYLAWLDLFAVYRYITALEMLSPLLVLLACGFLGPLGQYRLPAGAAMIGLLVVTTGPGTWIRVPFADKAVSATVPLLPQPQKTIVLLAGHEPLSFLLPSFPPEMRFLRIDSTFTNPDQATVRFNQVMREAVAAHQGPLLALFIPTERHDVVRRLGNYGLVLADRPCDAVTSPIGAAPYALCPVERRLNQ